MHELLATTAALSEDPWYVRMSVYVPACVQMVAGCFAYAGLHLPMPPRLGHAVVVAAHVVVVGAGVHQVRVHLARPSAGERASERASAFCYA